MSIHRCYMVEAAIADNPKFSISYREIESTGVNYTYVTLARFHNDYPDCELYFILGADSLFDFDSWSHIPYSISDGLRQNNLWIFLIRFI